LKGVLSLAIPSTVDSLIPSSSVMQQTIFLPSLSVTLVLIGTISFLNQPYLVALIALLWDSTAYLSYASLVIFQSLAQFSATYPVINKMFLPSSVSKDSGGILSNGTKDIILNIDILSTPPAIPQSMYPDLILATIFDTASRPLPQSLLTVVTGTVNGNPANISPNLVLYKAQPGASTLPMQISSTYSPLIGRVFNKSSNIYYIILSINVSFNPIFLDLVWGDLLA